MPDVDWRPAGRPECARRGAAHAGSLPGSVANVMHVGIVIPNLRGGGAESVARRWGEGLHSCGHRVTFYVYGGVQPEVFPPLGATIRHCGSRRRARLALWLRRRLDEDSPDVVLSMLTYSNVVSLLASATFRSLKVPLVISERTLVSVRQEDHRRRDRVVVWLGRRLYRRASAAVAISHPVALDLILMFRMPADRVFVVPNPVLPARHCHPRPALRRPEESAHLVFVGRLTPEKQPQLFLSVVRELLARGIATRATVIGDGPLRAPLASDVKNESLPVAFLGWRERWWESVETHSCLVLTSPAEGFGNVLVEAASAGIPSVASSRALGVSDAMVPGVTGVLTMTASAADLADGVMRTLRPFAEGDVAREWMERFSVENSTHLLIDVLKAGVQRHAR